MLPTDQGWDSEEMTKEERNLLRFLGIIQLVYNELNE